jgi:hypothetical protein
MSPVTEQKMMLIDVAELSRFELLHRMALWQNLENERKK